MKDRSSGFTLIEILIALVIMLVGILGIVTLFPLAIKNTGEATKDTEIGFFANSIKTSLEQAMRSAPPGGPALLKLVGLPKGEMKFPLPKYPEGGGESKFYMFPPTNLQYPPGEQKVVEAPPVGEGENFQGTSSDGRVYSPCVKGAEAGSETEEYMRKLGEEMKKGSTGSPPGGNVNLEKRFPAICNLSYAFDVQRPEPLPYYRFRIKVYPNYENQIKGNPPPESIKFESFWIIFSSNGD